jgi:uncharacterized SAM-binding protein YcdF (DUF218 family)
VLLVGAATPLWLPWIGLLLVVTDPLTRADAIVPLAGGDDRARYAVALWRSGYAHYFIASDIKLIGPYGHLSSALNSDLAVASGVLPWQIYQTDRIVTSTYTELQAIRDLAQCQGWRSLIIVTSPEHTRRTWIIARDVFHTTGIAISVQPVVGYGYDPAHWWRNGEERRLTGMEYAKLAAFLIGHRGQ